MPAITALAIHAAAPVARAVSTAGAGVWHGVRQFLERWKNRSEAIRLADLDEHMLADIGLTRSDLRDAYAVPLWRDPTDLLAQRAAERRIGNRRALGTCVASMAFASPFAAPPPVCCYPPLNRPSRYLM